MAFPCGHRKKVATGVLLGLVYCILQLKMELSSFLSGNAFLEGDWLKRFCQDLSPAKKGFSGISW
jgi:hypothetical protein